MTLPDDLIPINEAAVLVGRSVWTLRQWEIRGFASNGMRIKAVRDGVTKIRYFRRTDIIRIRRALLPIDRVAL